MDDKIFAYTFEINKEITCCEECPISGFSETMSNWYCQLKEDEDIYGIPEGRPDGCPLGKLVLEILQYDECKYCQEGLPLASDIGQTTVIEARDGKFFIVTRMLDYEIITREINVCPICQQELHLMQEEE